MKGDLGMNWKWIFYCNLIVVFLTLAVLVAVLHYRRRKVGRQVTLRDRHILGGIFLILGISFPIISHIEMNEEWKSQNFSGRIVHKRTTENHALIEYTIEGRDGVRIVILDELWKLQEFKVGDWIEKRCGAESVQCQSMGSVSDPTNR